MRKRAADVVGPENFILVHLDAPPEVCAERNLSAHAEGAEDEAQPNYEPPTEADLVLNTNELNTAECVEKIMDLLESKNIII